MHTFIYGKYKYDYELLKLDRKTFSLSVLPDRSIIVRCPKNAQTKRIEDFLKKKWMWLEGQLNYFKKYQIIKVNKEYVSGESFLYLGRQYKLLVKSANHDSVGLSKGVIVCHTTDSAKNKATTGRNIERWYAEKAKQIFSERFDIVFSKFDYTEKPKLVIKKMNKRWGSFVRGRSIILNPLLIHTSKDCIDYVITHELCHVKYRNHTKVFFKLLKSKCPDWEKIKEKLEMRLIS